MYTASRTWHVRHAQPSARREDVNIAHSTTVPTRTTVKQPRPGATVAKAAGKEGGEPAEAKPREDAAAAAAQAQRRTMH